MEPLLSWFMISSGLAIASSGRKKPPMVVTNGNRPTMKSGLGKGLLLVDMYWQETVGSQEYKKGIQPYKQGLPVKWGPLIRARDLGVIGAILKASDGISSKPNADFFIREWERLKLAAGDRYGTSWFRGAYHYIRAGVDGTKQADNFLSTVDKAGGWDLAGDILPIVDVERGGVYNVKGSVEDFYRSTSQWADRVKTVLDRETILYGRSVPTEAFNIGLPSLMGTTFSWTANWGSSKMVPMPEDVGRSRTLLWQYSNGRKNGTTFPTAVPGFTKTDMNVFLGRNRGEMMSLQAFYDTMVLGEE